MDHSENLVKVTIYGKEYTVKGMADSSYIQSVAEYVDGKMKEVDATVPFESSLRVAILAAMNITDELFSIKNVRDETFSEYEDRAKTLSDMLDESIDTLENRE